MHAELKKGIYWVGVVDWDLKTFHGHELSTHRGSTYNSYLILDEKVVLVDTVWGPFQEKLIENIKEIIDPAKIDIVVVNHAETDHSGALAAVMSYCPNATLVVNKRSAESVEGHYHQGWKYTTVKTGDRINIGTNDLVFVETPMLHWPDNMFTYVTDHRILLSNDAFGQHYATAYRFNDQVNEEELLEEALKYYANILTPFSDRVLKKIDEVLAMNLPVDIIAPSHGVIWRKDPIQIVKKYQVWAAQKPEPRVVFLYDTMWNATRKMAEAIGDGLSEKGVPFKLINMSVNDRNDSIVDVFNARTILLGSPTLNNGPISTLMPILEDIKGLKFKNRIAAAFGSYGWSGEAVKCLEEYLAKCKIPLIREGIKCKWQPSQKDLEDCRAFGREIADATLKA